MNLLIVEDHQLFRELVSRLCTTEHIVDSVTCCECQAEALEVLAETIFDVVLLDLCLPDGDGFDIAAYIATHRHGTKVIGMSSHCDSYTLSKAEQFKLDGFVDKNLDSLAALRAALSPAGLVNGYFSDSFRLRQHMRRHDPNDFTKVLSQRECAIIRLIGLSKSDDEIAAEMGISTKTAQGHRSAILRKLRLGGTPRLIQYAFSLGFTYLRTKTRDRTIAP